MIRFSAEVLGVEVINRAFNRVEEAISDLRSIWPEVAKEFYAIEREQFDSEGVAGAPGKWIPLTPAYKQWKEANFPGQPIEQLEGSLVASLTDPEALDAIYRPEKDELIIGTRLPYARRQHRTRPLISLSEVQKRRLQKAIQRGLVQFTRQAGFHVEERAA
jgi:phage gpG-like protein